MRKIFNSIFSISLLCTRRNILQISIEREEEEKKRNEPLFCKHIHVKIRIDNTRVVVVIRSFFLSKAEDGEEQEQRAYREYERDKDWHAYR
jgi:hypothetical protein